MAPQREHTPEPQSKAQPQLPGGPRGRRLLPHVVDARARNDPDRAFYVLTEDLYEYKTRTVTYGDLSRAVDRMAAWLDETLGKSSPASKRIAFTSQHAHDIRYFIAVLAGMKSGHIFLLPSPRNSAENNRHLLHETDCQAIIADAPLSPAYNSCGVQHIPAPSLETLLSPESFRAYPFQRDFDDAQNDIAFILHSSGSTGPPRPINWTHGKLTAMDRYIDMPVPHGTHSILDMYKGPGPHLALLPLFHAAACIYGLFWNIIHGNAHISLPRGAMPTAENTAQFLKTYHPNSLCAAPSILEDMIRDESMLESMQGLDFVHIVGASIDDNDASILQKRVKSLYNSMGSTEASCYPNLVSLRKDAVNYYYWPSETPGIEFREYQGLHELVFTRRPDFEWAIFHSFPELDEYPTKDLYEKHPGLPDHWKLVARTDDVLVLSNGEKVVPLPMEAKLRQCQGVSAALVVGDKQFSTAALLELENSFGNQSRREINNALRPYVDEANETNPSHARLVLDRVLFTNKDKPMARTAKGTVMRAATVKLYDDEIDVLYSDENMANSEAVTLVAELDESGTEQVLVDLIDNTTSRRLSVDADFFQAGLDSGNILAINRQIKSSLHKEFPDMEDEMSAKVVYSNPNVAALATAVRQLAHGESSDDKSDRGERIADMLEKYSRDISSSGDKRSQQLCKTGRAVLLTGSTGSLGSYLLHELISDPSVEQVFALNRSEDAATRQKDSNASKGLCSDFSKVTFYQSSFDEEQLGLSDLDYRQLVETVDLVIHNAWPVNFNQSLESFEPHVRGVRNFIDLSTASKHGAHILFVSSIGTTSNWNRLHPDSGAPEELIDDVDVVLEQGYSESKYVSEHLLTRAAQSGMNVTICRVGQIAGPVERSEGMWSKQEWLPSLIQTSSLLRMLPENLGSPGYNIDWIPVDSMARILVELGKETASEEEEAVQFRNLVNRQKANWDDLVPTVMSHLPTETKLVSFDDWLKSLKESCAEKEVDVAQIPAVNLMEFWESMQQGSHPSGLITNETCKASETIRNVKSVNEAWMRTWMEQWGFQSRSDQ